MQKNWSKNETDQQVIQRPTEDYVLEDLQCRENKTGY